MSEEIKKEAPAKKAAAKPAAAKAAAPKAAAAKAPKAAAAKPAAAPKAAKVAKDGAKVKVTQTGSKLGRRHDQEATLIGLGLNKMNRSRVLEDTPAVRGMIRKVAHLLRVEQA